MNRIDKIKEDYLQNDIVMSELIRNCYNDLSVKEKRELLNWSGDDEYVRVLSDGSIE